MILHTPFIQALAESAHDDPVWPAYSAGYHVLRVFDDWLQIGPVQCTLATRQSTLTTMIDAIAQSHPVDYRLLTWAVRTLLDADDSDPAPVVGPLLAYAELLEHRRAWPLAADVYQTVTWSFDSPYASPDPRTVALAQISAGRCWRYAQQYERAVEAYEDAQRVATRARDEVTALRARIGRANVARVRGDLSGAETALDAVIFAANTPPHPRSTEIALVRAAALHTRGSVRQARGRYDDAIIDLYDAYQGSTDPAERDLILGDLGACASVAGYREPAQYALEMIAIVGRHVLAQQMAIVNLMELAVLDNNRHAFEQWRSRWTPERCTSLINAYANLFIARGVERFDGRDAALVAFQTAATYASHAGIHQIEFEAIEELHRLETARPMTVPIAPVPIPKHLVTIADALKVMRDLMTANA